MVEEMTYISCRHCSAKNRIYKSQAVYNIKKATCGGCSKSLFISDDEDFKNIDSKSYLHPLDENALKILKNIPGVGTVLKFIMKESYERYYRMFHFQNFIQVTENHLENLYADLEYASKKLDMDYIPELFVMQSPIPNAYTMGVDKSYICVTTACIDLLNREQLIGTFAHEIGHIQCGHVLYKTAMRLLSWVIMQLARMAFGSTVSNLILPIYYGLLYWDRCSELSSDRAAMLVMRDFPLFVDKHMRFCSGSNKILSELNVERFLEQGEKAYSMKEDNFMNKMFAEFQSSSTTHPFPVWRTGAMKEWVYTDDFFNLIQGNYSKRDTSSQKQKLTNYNPDEFKDVESDKEKSILDYLKDIFKF